MYFKNEHNTVAIYYCCFEYMTLKKLYYENDAEHDDERQNEHEDDKHGALEEDEHGDDNEHDDNEHDDEEHDDEHIDFLLLCACFVTLQMLLFSFLVGWQIELDIALKIRGH